MKKNAITLLMLFITLQIISQEIPKFSLTKEGVFPIVVKVDSLASDQIYSRVIEWIQVTYKDPEKVLKADIKNKMIRINGYTKKGFYRLFSDGDKVFYSFDYSIEFNFKEGKYRMSFAPGEIRVGTSIVHFNTLNFLDEKDRNGNSYEGCKGSYEKTINDISKSIHDYILGEVDKNDNW